MKPVMTAALLLSLACQNEPAPDRSMADTAAITPAAAPADSVAEIAPGLSAEAVQGAWGRKGENFAWSVEGDSILFESDMVRYPFEVRADTLIIHRDPSIGIQKTRVLLFTADSMIIEDVPSETTETLFRLR